MPSDAPKGRSARAPVTVKPFQIRGRFLTAIALRIESETPDAAFYAALDEQLQQTPHLLSDAPLVLDFGKAPGLVGHDHIADLIDNLRARRLMVFGTQGANEAQAEAAKSLGLIPIQAGRDAPLPQARPSRASRAEKLLPPDNKVINTPVRSGQMIIAERGDLIVIGSVASGAELMAAGNIHVYGPLRGRAMAGVHGDETARIFCQHLNAELLAIAGLYRTSDSIDDTLRNRCVQVFLDDDTLCMEPLG